MKLQKLGSSKKYTTQLSLPNKDTIYKKESIICLDNINFNQNKYGFSNFIK